MSGDEVHKGREARASGLRKQAGGAGGGEIRNGFLSPQLNPEGENLSQTQEGIMKPREHQVRH